MLFVPLTYLLLSTLSPGPVTVLTIQNTSRYGRFAGTAVALGGATTTAVFVLISILLTDTQWVDVPLHTAHSYQQGGAIIILAMGLFTAYKSLFAKTKTRENSSLTNQTMKSYLTGMGLMTPYFPQAILFYTVILPHHVDAATLNTMILIMGLIKIVLTVGWYSFLAVIAQSFQNWVFHPRSQRFVEFAMACCLIGISLTMLI